MFHVKHFPDSHVHPVIKHSSSFMTRFGTLCSGCSLEIFLTVYVLYPTYLRLQKPLFLINPYQWILLQRSEYPISFFVLIPHPGILFCTRTDSQDVSRNVSRETFLNPHV